MSTKTAKFKLLVYSMLLASLSAFSWSDLTPLLQVRTIAVAPYGIENSKGNSGIYYELADALAKTLSSHDKVSINHQIYPYARIIHELKNGQTDLTIMFKYKELEDHVSYIAPLPTLKNVIIGLKGTHIKDLHELEGKTLAYLRGAKFSDAIDNNKKIFKITTKNFRQGINLLAAQRVDAIIGPLTPIIAAAQELREADDFFGTPLIVSERTPWLQISNQSKLMHASQLLKEQFTHLLSTNELERLKKKYLTHSRHLIESR
jgi:polar amino acid transport system substrate-binding protein